MIHSTAIVNPESQIDPTVEIGPYTIIGKDVTIDKDSFVGGSSYIEYASIGRNCKIYHSVCIGTPPQDFKYKGKRTRVIIGDNCIIREFATVHRASSTETTRVGSNCYLMAYSHVGHDSILGDEVVMSNCASLGGHVHIENFAVIGGLVAIHQFVRIGELSMLGGGAMVVLDIPPFMLASGDRAKLYGLNLVGIKRKGFSPKTIERLKKAYRILFMSKKSFKEALAELESINKDKNFDPKVEHLINFVKKTTRGICHP